MDENISKLFDESDIIAKKRVINTLAVQAKNNNYESLTCNSLLEQFHRTVEIDDIPHWEAATGEYDVFCVWSMVLAIVK